MIDTMKAYIIICQGALHELFQKLCSNESPSGVH